MVSRILVADDNADNIYLVRFLLEGAGHTVAVARGGREAVEMAKASEHDLVLMDIRMPEVDGVAAMHELLRDLPSPPPIVALTAQAMVGDRERLLAEGFSGYISKPIDVATFVRQVTTYLKTDG